MRFAYADPPYPGQAKRWYGNHPDYAGEVDHAELIARLERDYPDGWALSTNAVSLPYVLQLCPRTVRIAAWWNTNSQPPGAITADHWWWSWEPLIISGGRRGGQPVRNALQSGTGRDGRFPGGKPAVFCRWMFALLGAQPGDELDDLFPGSGAVGQAWKGYATSPWLEGMSPNYHRHDASNKAKQQRRMAREGFLEPMQ